MENASTTRRIWAEFKQQLFKLIVCIITAFTYEHNVKLTLSLVVNRNPNIANLIVLVTHKFISKIVNVFKKFIIKAVIIAGVLFYFYAVKRCD